MNGPPSSPDSSGAVMTRGDRAAVRVLMPVTLVLLVVLVIGLVGVSPLALGRIRGISQDWEYLSLIGQTYGAASALLAGLALAGVTATLVLQAREMRMSRELALRDSNSELLRMAMESHEYRECWGANLSTAGGRAQRQSMYTNMILSQWEMAYESHAIGDDHLRALVRNLFVGRVGWEFWNRVRSIRLRTAETRRSRRFHRLLDEEFQRSHKPPPEEPEVRRGGQGLRLRPLTVGGIAACVIAAGVAITQRQRILRATAARRTRRAAGRPTRQRGS